MFFIFWFLVWIGFGYFFRLLGRNVVSEINIGREKIFIVSVRFVIVKSLFVFKG